MTRSTLLTIGILAAVVIPGTALAASEHTPPQVSRAYLAINPVTCRFLMHEVDAKPSAQEDTEAVDAPPGNRLLPSCLLPVILWSLSLVLKPTSCPATGDHGEPGGCLADERASPEENPKALQN